ncbi:MAG TPA: ABC transporter permease [Stellaceae bacterium]|jgi:NitT/TauT family transport system permease protein
MSRYGIIAGRIAIVVGLAMLWEGLSRTGAVSPRFLPPLSDTVATVLQLIGRPAVRADIAVTLLETLAAFAIALPAGALIGLAIAESAYLGEILKPLVFFLLSIPKSVFLPLFILSFGIGFAEKVGFGFFSTILIVIMSTTAAVESVRPEHVVVARSYGATGAQIVRRVYLPSMLPVLLEAVRVAMIFNFTGIILAEMYASRTGLGHQIASWGENFMMKQLLAGVLLVSAMAIVFNELVRWAETRCSHWRT